MIRSFPLLALATLAPAWLPAAEPTPDFARDIRPLLERRCYECHDGRKHKAELRLDVKDSALRGGESGTAGIVPGKPEESEVLRRVASTDESEHMPPEGKPLTTAEVELLRAWIAAGADWPAKFAAGRDPAKHWAFQTPQKPPVPPVNDESWLRNPIDRFVLARLEKEKMAPSAEADRIALIRRLSLDLTGLPPTVEEVDAFLADSNEQAYARAVERLLESPHYGEKWARFWLDAARYADSDGYEKDKPRDVWFYRDWVIGALNRDLPYDQFVVEQLAGDLLPNPTQDQLVATGFLRNSMINEEGGIDPEQFRMEAMFDRMDALGKAVLGLTIQCAQCHDHKYDPLTQQEYYRLFAFLNNAHEANVAVYTADEEMRRAALFRSIAEIEAELQHQCPDWRERMAAWEATVKDDQPHWTVLQPSEEDLTTGGQKYLPRDDGSVVAQGYAPTKHTAAFHIQTDLSTIAAFQLELFNDPNLPCQGPGRSIWGTSALSEFEVTAAPADDSGKSEKLKLVAATADVNPEEKELHKIFDDKTDKRRVTGPIAYAIDSDQLTAWGTDNGPGRRNVPRKAVFVPEKPITSAAGWRLTINLVQMHGGWNSDDNQNNNLGRFRLSATDAADVKADPLPKRVREILSLSPEERTPTQDQAVFSYWRTTVPEWKEANDRIEELWKSHPEGASQLVLLERESPRTTSILKRGDFLKPVSAVEPGVPAFLHPLAENAKPDRLALARWLTDRRSPTTARSLVNRVWQQYFGIGLASTSEDLGVQCEPPSHPELLDWLAVEFMDRGWSLKELHRLIVSSATYRQSSEALPELYARDPQNRLLARGPRFRVDAEAVRDIALAASGLLTPAVGGPSVYPPLPEFMTKPPVSYGPKTWPTDSGPNRYRRGLYTFRFRSVPYPVLQNFDSPNGDFACVRRARSNTPLQALTTLNEPVFVECAQALAARTMAAGGATDSSRLEYAFRRCLSRPPRDEESKVLQGLLEDQKKHVGESGVDPWEIATADPAHKPSLPEGMAPADAAAWVAVCRVLLNLDETITKE